MTSPDVTNIRTIVRAAARLIVIAPDDRVLLMAWQSEHLRSPDHRVWITPGGGLEPGETHEQAAERELREETGIDAPLGPCVWERRHLFKFNDARLDQRERFYVVRAPDATWSRAGWTDYEHRDIVDVRWWSVEEIAASTTWFAPRRLAELVPEIIAGQYPNTPFDCGV